jgi:hypothetical protein
VERSLSELAIYHSSTTVEGNHWREVRMWGFTAARSREQESVMGAGKASIHWSSAVSSTLESGAVHNRRSRHPIEPFANPDDENNHPFFRVIRRHKPAIRTGWLPSFSLRRPEQKT